MSLDDCQLIPAENPEHASFRVLQILDQLHSEGLAVGDVLVLCPTNDGATGRLELNKILQPRYNDAPVDSGIRQWVGTSKDPDGSIRKREEEIRRGDRVMVTKNNRELGVFNGQTGIVVDVSVPRSFDVEIDGRVITFSGEHRKSCTLAYAITGHKSQGSEAPFIVAPIFPSQVLSREWLYTVLTRAKKAAYLVGDIGAIQACLAVRRSHMRRTGLVARILAALEGGEE
jgi:exodeoxyribonuclease V alpha subunit